MHSSSSLSLSSLTSIHVRIFIYTNNEIHQDGQMLVHESKVFCMAGKDNDCGAEFLPRFRSSFANAHVAFRDAVVNNQPFAVTQLEVLDAQVRCFVVLCGAINSALTQGCCHCCLCFSVSWRPAHSRSSLRRYCLLPSTLCRLWNFETINFFIASRFSFDPRVQANNSATKPR